MSTITRLGLAMLLFGAFSATLAAEKPKTTVVQGRVTAVSDGSLTITHGSDTMTFAVDASTKVKGKGLGTMMREKKEKKEPFTIADGVAKDDLVKVMYHDIEGKLHAAEVTVVAKGLEKE